MCARGAVLGAFGRAARTHRPDDGAIPILGAHGCAQTERSPRRERPLPRTQHTRQRRREWAKSGASVGALRSRLARTAVGVHARRSLDAADSVRWSRAAGDLGSPARNAAHRGAHQLLSCDGLSGVNGSVASRGVSARAHGLRPAAGPAVPQRVERVYVAAKGAGGRFLAQFHLTSVRLGTTRFCVGWGCF